MHLAHEWWVFSFSEGGTCRKLFRKCDCCYQNLLLLILLQSSSEKLIFFLELLHLYASQIFYISNISQFLKLEWISQHQFLREVNTENGLIKLFILTMIETILFNTSTSFPPAYFQLYSINFTVLLINIYHNNTR